MEHASREFVASFHNLLYVAGKAFLLYITAVAGFRLTERRTLAELSAFDFVAAVAVGAIVGRVPNSTTITYFAGAVTLATLFISHRFVSKLRESPKIAGLIDHPARVLVRSGRVRPEELRKSGLTQADLYGLLRQSGITDVNQVEFVIFESRGKISVVRATPQNAAATPGLVRDIVTNVDRT